MISFNTIRKRLLIVPTVAIVAVAVTSALGLYGLSQSNEALRKSTDFNSAILHAKQADMMHDALRGDVLQAMLVGSGNYNGDGPAIRQALDEHLRTLQTELRELSKQELPPEVVLAVERVEPALERYGAEAIALLDLALTQPLTASNQAASFQQTFEELEVELENLGSQIEGMGREAAAVETQARQFMITALAIWGAVSAAVFIAISWKVAQSITRPIARVSAAMVDVGNGNLEVEIPETANTSELGFIARSLDSLRQKLQTASEMEAERRHLQEEQGRVTEALRIGLGDLSAGNFSRPITTPFAPEYDVLREDFNNAVEKLSWAISVVAGSAETIRARSTELSRAAADLAHRTETQAATLEQTAAAMDQITNSVISSTSSTREVEAIVRQARKEAEDTGEVVKGAVAAMVEIEKSSSHISQIISVIDDIAFQTNLLALNAGVEAARAGDAGRGFAVVASEVGALAQRSSMAAKEIKMLIGESTQNVGLGVDQVGLAGQALTNIVDRVAQISTLVSNIAAGAIEQSTGLGEINSGVTQLDLATQQNAAMVEEATAASQLLSQSANSLTDLMAQFAVSEQTMAVQAASVANGNAVEPATPVLAQPGTGSARTTASQAGSQVRGGVAAAGAGQRVWADF